MNHYLIIQTIDRMGQQTRQDILLEQINVNDYNKKKNFHKEYQYKYNGVKVKIFHYFNCNSEREAKQLDGLKKIKS